MISHFEVDGLLTGVECTMRENDDETHLPLCDPADLLKTV
jgi:hypothetical protein